MTAAGRYAPSPSGPLHLGNLRTAMLAWLFARSTGRRFIIRVEDVDTGRSRRGVADQQLRDLEALGIDWDGEVSFQQDRYDLYQAALEKLDVYECYCSRKDILEASRAPHAIPGHYPGTCRDLTDREGRRQALGRTPALRLRANVHEFTVHDYYAGEYTGDVDDFIVKRDDWAYNLAVVVDDYEQGVDQVVRGSDLLSSAPRQAYLATLLGYPVPEYIHVPLVLDGEGKRLAKRDLANRPDNPLPILAKLIAPAVDPEARSAQEMLASFQPELLPREDVIWA